MRSRVAANPGWHKHRPHTDHKRSEHDQGLDGNIYLAVLPFTEMCGWPLCYLPAEALAQVNAPSNRSIEGLYYPTGFFFFLGGG